MAVLSGWEVDTLTLVNQNVKNSQSCSISELIQLEEGIQASVTLPCDVAQAAGFMYLGGSTY